MKKLFVVFATLSLVGCSSLPSDLTRTLQNVQNTVMGQGGVTPKYDEVVYVKMKRCPTKAEIEQKNKEDAEQLKGVPLYLRAQLAEKEAINNWNLDCVDSESYSELAQNKNCRLDYFGEIECAKHVYTAEEAENLRYKNRTLFHVRWNYKEETSYEVRHVTDLGSYDVNKYSSTFEKLKKNRQCKLIDKKTLSCNMKELKELKESRTGPVLS